MTASPPRVVLDTVVFVQALISGRGHAAGCVERLRAGDCILLSSNDTLDELRDVSMRPKLRAKYPFLTDEKAAALIAEIESVAIVLPNPPSVISLPRDPKDEPFVDLAVAGAAQFIVTWNERHLTYLMKQDTPEGRDFCTRFPNIRIVSPPDFLDALDRE